MKLSLPGRLQQPLTTLRQSSLARNAGWMLAGQGLNVVFQAAYFILLARLLGTVEYGIYAGAIALVTILGNFSSLGSGTLFVRYVTADRKNFSVYWGNILLSTFLLSGFVILGLKFFASHFVSSSSASIIVVVAIGECFCRQLAYACGQVFQTYEKLKITALLNLLTSFLRLLASGALLLALHHATARQWAAASLIVSLLVSASAVFLVQRSFGRPTFSLRLARQRATEGFGFSFSGSAASVFNDVDKTMLSHHHMDAANGIYTVAYRVVDIGTMPVYSLFSAAFPRFFASGDNPAAARTYAERLVKRSVLMALVLAAGMFLLAPVLPVLAGKGFAESVSALRWLCLIPMFRSLHLSAGSALTGSGLQRYRTGSDVFVALLNVGLNLYLIPRYGWHGAAFASLASDGTLGILNWTLLAVLSR
ncbi:flippase [Acidipila sp. EB88]|uniref:flippase n=1 Tax=Acidipila sp. EB88 TaxID=2305226 RepID=UPI000F5F315B|nr:flippase [Acidipila sp. EB88]RRA48239.1 flippase [Acidipila sp. EB88]